MELHNRLVDLRKAKSLSQEKLAEKLYVSRQTISNWERGKTYPDIDSLLLIATFFDISLDNLIKGDVDLMKHQVEKAKMRNWFTVTGLLVFVASLLQPIGRFYKIPNFELINYLFILALVYCIYHIYRLSRDNRLNTYSQILTFMSNNQVVDEKSWWSEIKNGFIFIVVLYLLIILGQSLGSLLFYRG